MVHDNICKKTPIHSAGKLFLILWFSVFIRATSLRTGKNRGGCLMMKTVFEVIFIEKYSVGDHLTIFPHSLQLLVAMLSV